MHLLLRAQLIVWKHFQSSILTSPPPTDEPSSAWKWAPTVQCGGGHLLSFVDVWEACIPDALLQEVVPQGYKLEFHALLNFLLKIFLLSFQTGRSPLVSLRISGPRCHRPRPCCSFTSACSLSQNPKADKGKGMLQIWIVMVLRNYRCRQCKRKYFSGQPHSKKIVAFICKNGTSTTSHSKLNIWRISLYT